MPQSRTTKEPRPNAQQDRRHPHEGALHTGKNGGAKGGKDIDAIAGPRIHLLAKELRSYSKLEVSFLNGDSTSKFYRLIDTEAKQLQAIEDLYRIIKAQPKYKNLKEPNWKVETSPAVVLLWLLKKLGPLSRGARWTIDGYMEGKKLRYQYVLFDKYPSDRIKPRCEFLPLCFLPRLKKKDELLHDVIVDIIALVSRNNKVPLWDEDGDYSDALEDLINTNGETNFHGINEDYKQYTEGLAAEYLGLIKKRKKKVTAAEIREKMARFEKMSQRKQSAEWWVKIGLNLASFKDQIRNHSYIAPDQDGKVIEPWRLYKFVWSTDVKDFLHYDVKNWLARQSAQVPVMKSVTKPGRKITYPQESQFPLYLYRFMSVGVKHFQWWYRDYYFGRQPKLEDQRHQMIEDILEEEQEILIDI
jgi:hypothetical protein